MVAPRSNPRAFFIENDVERELRELSKRLKKTSGVELRRAQARVLNSLVRKIRSRVIREVARELKIRNKDLSKMGGNKKWDRISMVRAATSQRYLFAELKAIGTGIPLIDLKHTQTRRGVRTRAKTVDGAFIATPTATPVRDDAGRYRKSENRFHGDTQVFKRLTDDRYPLRVVRLAVRKALSKHLNSSAGLILKQEAALMMKKELEYRIAKQAGFK